MTGSDDTKHTIGEPATSPTHGRDVFNLGAGFSNAIATQVPTMVELGEEVRERLSVEFDLVSAIPASLGDNIELWMTYLTQLQPWLREPDIDLHCSLCGRIRLSIADVIEERTLSAFATMAPDRKGGGRARFSVFRHGSHLHMPARKPQNLERLADCHGVGASKLDRYGTRFLDEIRAATDA